ncbi:hypothetical protein FK216_05105 [Moraxellaceae bacterium AER2_44_116]|nr:hypothetical protein [Moraxellaceae bacterium]TQC98901.1 hypothetical protein FK216_05105 [Moraxellaceae bacterium AER2_44_116]
MILRGILAQSFSNFTCIRGFAKLSDLAKISKADERYQRELIEQHCQDLESFLDQKEYIFFPEIILGYTINNQVDNIRLSPTAQILDSTGEKSKPLSITVSIKTYKGTGDIRNEEHIRTATLKIDDNYANKLFNRIDGNHRLTAAEHLSPEKTNILAPFCLILFTDNDINTKQQSVIFHNINSKGENLTSEQNLKSIFDNISFSDEDLMKQFGWTYVKARQLIKSFDTDVTPNLNHLLQDKKRSTFVQILTFLEKRNQIKAETPEILIKQKILRIEEIYREEARLRASTEIGLLSAFLYYAFKESTGTTLLTSFKVWLLSKNIDQIKELDADSIVDIFDKIHESQIKIFMAMPYYNKNIVNHYDNTIFNAINCIKNRNPLINLIHHPIMDNQSPTHDLIGDIFKKIQNCDIFVADITGDNSNVLYEYGFAKGHNKPCILLRKKSTTPVKSDYANDLRFEFDEYFELADLFELQIRAVLSNLGYVLN